MRRLKMIFDNTNTEIQKEDWYDRYMKQEKMFNDIINKLSDIVYNAPVTSSKEVLDMLYKIRNIVNKF